MLKSLELFGFKTFADRTRFEFSGGITCIVGPNGSGKSNIVDAIKWILGDQSPKSLRGKEMADVIFNGSASRKPSNFAEATLTLDNSTGWLPIETAEVQIGRRLWRNGDSEYLLNGQPARLKDIRHLMLGTGAAHGAYNIIEQGRVDQILQAAPTARRTFFEEAAGISRYKARKVEAERKLERVAHNVERLRDIVDEVETQLTATKSQATKAAKFRALSEQVRRLWFGLACDEFRLFQSQLEEVEDEARQTRQLAERLGTELTELAERLTQLDTELAESERLTHQLERERAICREQIVTCRSSVRHQQLRRAELTQELEQLHHERTQLTARAREAVQQAQRLELQVERSEKELQERRDELAEQERQIDELAAELKQRLKQLQAEQRREPELVRLMAEKENEVRRLSERLKVLSEQDQQVTQQLEQLAQTVQQQQAVVEERRRSVETQQRQVEEAQTTLQQRKQQLEAALEQLGRSQSRLAELRERRSGLLARLDVLQEMERRQEGLSLGVQDILTRAATSRQPPWSHVLGSVADLLEVDLEEAPFLDVALGPRAQLLVLDDLRPLLQWLSENPVTFSGRVGFLAVPNEAAEVQGPAYVDSLGRPSVPTPQVTRSLHRQNDLSGLPGVIKRADQMVEPTGVGGKLAEFLLADTWIVDTLQTALELARHRGRGCRFVTLQGEVLEPDGILYAGTERPEEAVVTRKSELKRLKRELTYLENQLEQEQQRLTQLDDNLRHLKTLVTEATAQLQTQTRAAADQQSELERLLQRLEQLKTQQRKLQQQEQALRQERQRLETQRTEAEGQLQTLQNELKQLQQKLEQEQTQVERTQHRQQALQYALAEAKLELAKSEEHLRALKDSLNRYRAEADDWLRQADDVNRRWTDCHQKIQEIDSELLRADAEAAELYWHLDQLVLRLKSQVARTRSLREQRSQLSNKQTALRQQQRAAEERLHSLTLRVNELKHQLETTRSRLEEEYQVSFDEILQSGFSAYRDYLEELRARRAARLQQQPEKTETPEPTATDNPNVQTSTEGDNQTSSPTADAQPLDQADLGSDKQPQTDSQPAAPHATSEQTSSSTPSDASPASPSPSTASASPQSVPAEGHASTDTPLLDASADQLSQQPEPTFEEIRPELEQRLARLRRKLKNMGSVNTDSLEKLDELESRYNRLRQQLDDLVEAKETLEEIIRKINQESRKLFLQSFETIRLHFRELYRKLFAGGDADIILEDPSDALECGIDIIARPPGKESRSISLLSGGEKTLTAIALLLAIFKSRPSPFCILDEVDAALDEANIDRYAAILKQFKDRTQFIIVTHSKRTMVVADTLYGVTMQQSGVSKKLSLRFEDVGEDGQILTKTTEETDSLNTKENDAA